MPELPWKSVAQPVPDREYVAILTYLPLKSFSTLPQFFYYSLRSHMDDSAFTRWKLNGAAVPPSWRAAMEQLPKAARIKNK